MAEVKLSDPDNLILQAAILASIGAQGQEIIVRQAIEHLTSKDRNSYGGKSPLDRVLSNTCERLADTVLTAKLEADEEFQKQVNALFVEAVKTFLSVENRAELVKKMVAGMNKAFEPRY